MKKKSYLSKQIANLKLKTIKIYIKQMNLTHRPKTN